MSKSGDSDDPKGLIREAYRIEAIGMAECRSIFVDWALSLPEGADTDDSLSRLIARHGDAVPDHPMSVILREGLDDPTPRGRRGGRRGRLQ
ncbi:hypothetical protein [Pseudooceanicola sp.]|uniref:hypothetical protein n=1 Tax=Pseudooceanicola sp. TaxID=1914328 RepID=UPI002608F476|nr:hypothetical protein [Pseudooceanicola sp.]MDF1854919.1 hypothetical protein [Pseudooceanicola sp.]